MILRKIIKIIATRCQILRLKCTKFDFLAGAPPDPAEGTYSAPPDPLAGFKGPLLGREGKGKGREEKGKGYGDRGNKSDGTRHGMGRGGKGREGKEGRGGKGRRGYSPKLHFLAPPLQIPFLTPTK